MSYVFPVSSFKTYLSPCFVIVPEKVWLPLSLAAPLAADPDCGVRFAGVPASGLWFEFGICEFGVVASGDCDPCCDDGVRSVLSGGGVGVVFGDEDGCCA